MYDNSEMFEVDPEQAVRDLHLFNGTTEIIKPGQHFKVVFGEFEEEHKTFNEIVMPYLYKFAVGTAEVAAKTGQVAYEAIKAGWLWVYNKFVDEVVPFAVQNLPKIVFIARKQQLPRNIHSSSFEVLDLQKEDYNRLPKNPQYPQYKGKTRVVIPLGTQKDAHILEVLEKDQYQFNYSFPIDVDSEDNFQARETFMIPSQSFEVVLQKAREWEQSFAQLQMTQTLQKQQKEFPRQKSVIRLQNCLIFELQGKNSIEYEMLDCIVRDPNATTGYIVMPEQTLRSSISPQREADPIAQLVSGKEEEMKMSEEEKVVDMQRNVHVQTEGRKWRKEADLMLN